MIVIGNGESRLGIDLQKIKEQKVGCNAIYRDVTVKHLVCVDKRILLECLKTGYNNKNFVYTRPRNWVTYRLENNIKRVPVLPYQGNLRPDQEEHWGSGPYAVLIGAMKAKEKELIKLVGFDFYSKDRLLNNVYKDTLNYGRSTDSAVDPRYWIYQIGKVFECFPQKKFIVYNNDNWIVPKQWKYSNVFVDSISNI